MEAAGLAIGVVGMIALFNTCIEGFDIVVKAREFGDEFDLLCTQLSLQRIRLLLWGETLGLGSESTLPYHRRLEAPDIAPAIESTLHHLRSLLQRADLITDRYTLQGSQRSGPVQVEPSKGLTIFSDKFDSFKTRIRRNQKDKSTWTVTRWAIHDLGRFRTVITSIKDLIDGLEGITSAIGLLKRQHALLAQEVDLISDTQSLHLLYELASSDDQSPSIKLVSDAASARLSIFSDSHSTGPFRSKRVGSANSYRTAFSHRFETASMPSMVEEESEDEISLHTAAPFPAEIGNLKRLHDAQRRGGADGHRETSQPSDVHVGTVGEYGTDLRKKSKRAAATLADEPRGTLHLEAIPQNQRLMAEVMRKSKSPLPQLRFDCGSSNYGNTMTAVKTKDASNWDKHSAQFLVQADKGISSARRMFLELRSIKQANVPFISAAPLGDSLDKVIATVEGPPDTPYEGGIFRILVSFSPINETAPPELRFLTRIYHPNIDCNGTICADYYAWWDDVQQIGTSSKAAHEPWFSARKSNWYSLGALLTALCALLASPNVEDPLVLEIAETYVRNYSYYCDAARLYTRKFAREDIPLPECLDAHKGSSTTEQHRGLEDDPNPANPGSEPCSDKSTHGCLVSDEPNEEWKKAERGFNVREADNESSFIRSFKSEKVENDADIPSLSICSSRGGITEATGLSVTRQTTSSSTETFDTTLRPDTSLDCEKIVNQSLFNIYNIPKIPRIPN